MTQKKENDKEKGLPADQSRMSEASRRCYSLPRQYFNRTLVCRDCGREFVFSAAEQKRWYEELGRYILEYPLRCPDDHRRYREQMKTKPAMDEALAALKEHPNNQKLMFKTARAIIDSYKATGQGNLEKALHLLKQSGMPEKTTLPLAEYCRRQLKSL